MGGNALKIATRRYSKQEYYNILPEIESLAKQIFDEVCITKCYSDKDSFGDIDVLCLSDDLGINLFDKINEVFKPTEIFRNTNMWSFDYKEIQVDFILTSRENWETSKIYYSYNDVCNLIGKIAHRFGIKFGYKGLVWVGFIPQKTEIILTKDHNKILEFLGFDSKAFNIGFKTLEEIFNFIIESKYFNPVYFDLDLHSSSVRDRDIKRVNYQLFLQKIEPLKNKDYLFLHPTKDYYLGLIDHYFPGFLKQYSDIFRKKEVDAEVKKIFNGNIVKHLYGNDFLRLRKDLEIFKNSFDSKQSMNSAILELGSSEKVLELYKNIVKS